MMPPGAGARQGPKVPLFRRVCGRMSPRQSRHASGSARNSSRSARSTRTAVRSCVRTWATWRTARRMAANRVSAASTMGLCQLRSVAPEGALGIPVAVALREVGRVAGVGVGPVAVAVGAPLDGEGPGRGRGTGLRAHPQPDAPPLAAIPCLGLSPQPRLELRPHGFRLHAQGLQAPLHPAIQRVGQVLLFGVQLQRLVAGLLPGADGAVCLPTWPR